MSKVEYRTEQSIEQSSYKYSKHNVDVLVCISFARVLIGNIAMLDAKTFLYIYINAVHEYSSHTSPDNSYDDIAWIMYPKIDPCVAVDNGPQNKRNAEQTASNGKTKEQGYRHCVGCMCREETINATSIAVDNINRVSEHRVVAWTITHKHWFDQHIDKIIGKGYSQNCKENYQSNLPHCLIVADYKV